MAPPSLSAPGHAAVGVILVRGLGSPCLAVPLPPPRGMRLVAEGTTTTTTYLLFAPAASRRDVRCAVSRGSGDSDHKENDMLGFGAAFQPLAGMGVPPVATRRDTHLARASSSSPALPNFNEDKDMLGFGAAFQPLAGMGVPPVTTRRDTHLARASSSNPAPPNFNEDKDMLGFGAAFQPLIGMGVPPVATRRDTHLARATSSNPAPANFNHDFAMLVEVEASRINCLGLVGQPQVLDEIAYSAARLMKVVSMLIPEEVVELSPEAVKMLVEGGEEERMPPRLEIAVETMRALKTVHSECVQGYVREQSLVWGIAEVRKIAIAPEGYACVQSPVWAVVKMKKRPTPDMLPLAYAGIAAASDKLDKVSYFIRLGKELEDLALLFEKEVINN